MKPEICTGDAHLIREARVSFPSGHSSFTVYSMVFVIVSLNVFLIFMRWNASAYFGIVKVYLEARTRVSRARFIKTTFQLIAFIAAWHTCMSRVSDFKHHHTDVIAGAAIGEY